MVHLVVCQHIVRRSLVTPRSPAKAVVSVSNGCLWWEASRDLARLPVPSIHIDYNTLPKQHHFQASLIVYRKSDRC